MSVAGVILIICSVSLAAVNVAGEFGLAHHLDLGGDTPEKNPSDKTSEKSCEGFVSEFRRSGNDDAETFFVSLSERLTGRFFHGPARYTLWSNYVFRLVSKKIRWLESIENTEYLFRYSRQALCHQVAQAFVDIATRLGRSARVVSFNGHIIAEAYYEGAWHAFDPDYGVIPWHEGRILSVDELVSDSGLAAEAYRNHRFEKESTEVLKILAGGPIGKTEVGGHLSADISRRQRALHRVRWLLPGGLFLIGMALALGAG